MTWLSRQHPIVVMTLAALVSLVVALTTQSFWAVVVVGAAGLTPLRRSVRRV